MLARAHPALMRVQQQRADVGAVGLAGVTGLMGLARPRRELVCGHDADAQLRGDLLWASAGEFARQQRVAWRDREVGEIVDQATQLCLRSSTLSGSSQRSPATT